MQKIYKWSVIAVFVVMILFRIQINYENKLEQANNTIIELNTNLANFSHSLNYLQEYKKELHQDPIYEWPIHIDDYDRMTSEFGYRILHNPFTGGNKDSNHIGIDLTGTHHARVLAVTDGEVVEFYPPPNGYFKGDPIFGGKIIIHHTDGRYSMYAHLSITYNISEHGKNRFVKAGQVIGRTGNTGMSYGEHLHFTLYDREMKPIQPLFYLKDPRDY